MTGVADVVLLDLFGVIAAPQPAAAVHRLTEVAGVAAPAFLEAYWRHRAPYDRGEVSAAEYWRLVAADLGTAFDRDRVEALVAADVASWQVVDDEMVALVERVAAAGVRLGLLSNIPEELAAHYERRHDRWLRHFALVAFSCRIGQAKPEPAAFRWCVHRLGADPDRILFIDDRAENVDAAARLGLRTHQFADVAGAARAIESHSDQLRTLSI